MKDTLLNKISNFTAKLTQLKWIQGISRGGMQVMPFIMVGSFASLFAGLQFESYQSFLTSTGLGTALQLGNKLYNKYYGNFICIFYC